MEMIIYSIIALKTGPGQLNTVLNGMKGVSGNGLYAVTFNEIAAVVSDIGNIDFITDKSVAIEYAGVIEALYQQFTLIPMRFGSIMGSTCPIIRMLERNYSEIQKNLQKVDNKFEFGLKVICNSETLKTELQSITAKDTSTVTITSSETKNSIYRDYVNKKLQEHRLEDLLLGYVDSVITDITRNLDRLNAINKFKRMLTASIMVDSVFLLDKWRKDDLIEAVGDIQDHYPRLKFVMTGPWPPYNFVEITIK